MSIDESLRSRRPRGAPDSSGGQFAEEPRDESQVPLEGPALYAAARTAVRRHAFRADLKFVGEDDLVQDTIEHVLRNKQRKPGTVLTRPYVSQVAFGTVGIAARGRLRAEDRKAMGIFLRRREEIERERGYRLSGAEADELAAQIRADWHDRRHRPSVNFVELASVRTYSLDAQTRDESARTLGETLADRVDHDGGFAVDPGTPAAAVLSGELTDKKILRARAWSILASVSQVPDVVPGSLSAAAARRARTRVADAGGVLAVVAEWDSGDGDEDAVEGLFAPFGQIDEGARDRVCDLLRSKPQYAEVLFQSAVRSATAKAT
ncbi:hypothetical protein GCM10027059_50520 [Myceligenerans halotolerans]